jgi:hypothetical protein
MLKHVNEGEREGRIKVTEDGDEDVSNYLMTKKRLDTGN